MSTQNSYILTGALILLGLIIVSVVLNLLYEAGYFDPATCSKCKESRYVTKISEEDEPLWSESGKKRIKKTFECGVCKSRWSEWTEQESD